MAQAEKSPKSKKSAPTPAPVADVAVPALPEVTVPPPGRRWLSRSTVITLLFLSTVTGGVFALQQVLPDLTDRPEYQFRMEETRINPPHAWVPRGILKEVLDAADLPESVSLLDPELCQKATRAWERHPWVKRVKSVRIDAPLRTLVVDLEYRAPVAFIEVAQGFYPVDVDGVLLPPRDFSVAETSLLPHVRNIFSLPQAGAGNVWEDPAVIGGARLAAVLAPEQDLKQYWDRFKFKSIIAPKAAGAEVKAEQLTFELETAGGNRVVWGKAPGADVLEPTPEVKLARLIEYQNRFGTLDGVSGLHRIDIRQFDGFSLQPMGTDRYR